MGKSMNKATRKFIRKGHLNFTSRVSNSKKKGGGLNTGKPTNAIKKKTTIKNVGRGGEDMKRKLSKKRIIEEQDEEEEEETAGGEGDAIEDMDVDSFLRSGIFGDEDDEEIDEEDASAEDEDDEESEGSEEEEEMLDGPEEEEDEEEESNDDGSLKNEVERHKEELERLKAKDPEFFKFLEKNDDRLLAFGDEDGGDDEEEDDEEEDEEAEAEAEAEEEEPEKGEKPRTKELTLTMLTALEKTAFGQHSLKALRKIILAFKAASHMADESSRKGEGFHSHHQQPFSIASSQVFDRLLITCLTSLPEAFGYHLFQDPDYRSSDPTPFAKLGSIPAFRVLKPMIYRTLKALHYLLGQITEASLLVFILQRLERFVLFLIPFSRQAKLYLKTWVHLWATSEDLQVKLAAFLRIRQAATVLPFPFLEHCLKALYLAYARSAKFVNESSLPGLVFMGNCLVEVYGLDMTSSYQHAFVYLRQLALLLRAGYTKKTTEALQKVQSWQYLNCLKVWVAILTAYSSSTLLEEDQSQSDQLRELVFPLSQLILGLIRLSSSSPRHYPLVLHCLTLLQRLAAATAVFIPSASYALDILESPAFTRKKKAKPSTDAIPNLTTMIKLGKDLLETRNVQDAVIGAIADTLTQEILIYRYTIAFPEYAFPLQDRLKKVSRNISNPRWSALLRGVLEECGKATALVEKERTKRELAPSDDLPFEVFLKDPEQTSAVRLKAFLQAKADRDGLVDAPSPHSNTKKGVVGQSAAVKNKQQQHSQMPSHKQKKKEGQIGGSKSSSIGQAEAMEGMDDKVGGIEEWSSSEEEEEEEECTSSAEE